MLSVVEIIYWIYKTLVVYIGRHMRPVTGTQIAKLH
jgi:hypothetical protein